MTRHALFPTPLGRCGIAWRGEAVVATRLPDAHAERTAAALAAGTGSSPGAPPDAIARAIAAITALLEGKRTDLRFVACDPGPLDAFREAVLAATRAVPPGETTTYGAIAARLGDPRRAQEVGQALGRNPLPIIVPCHRVLGANGRLTGFSAPGGVATKLRMLRIEGARIGDEPGLFDALPLALAPRGR